MDTPYRIYLSTSSKLLQLNADCAGKLYDLKVLHENLGIYTGITVDAKNIYAIAQNRIPLMDKPNLQAPSKNIVVLDKSSGEFLRRFTIPEANHLEDLQYHDGYLWTLNNKKPELILITPGSGKVAYSLSLLKYVGPVVKKLATTQYTDNDVRNFTFKGLSFEGDKLYLLVSAKDKSSCCLVFDYKGPANFVHAHKVSQVLKYMGRHSNNLVRRNERTVCLSSYYSTLLINDGKKTESIKIPNCDGWYPQGIAFTDTWWMVAMSKLGRKKGEFSEVRLMSLDRHSNIVNDGIIGNYGNTYALHIEN